MLPDRLSIEVSNRCGKGCSFCYSASIPDGESRWTADELVAFATDCAANGVGFVSFGGGEPLEWAPILEVLVRLDGIVARSLTTNGLALARDPDLFERLVAARPDKVHVSIHFPGNGAEVARVIATAQELDARGIPSGINLLVARSSLLFARLAATAIAEAGIGPERVVYLPMRGEDTPLPDELASITGPRFQSMTCLEECGNSPRFASVSWDKRVGWCSYTTARNPLPSPTHAALAHALSNLGLTFCGGLPTATTDAVAVPVPVADADADADAVPVPRPSSIALAESIPAAHSMDTHWFAVDADGHVARFSSGEAGAVPIPIESQAGDGDTFEALINSRPHVEIIHELDGRLFPWHGPIPLSHHRGLPRDPADGKPIYTLMFVGALDDRLRARVAAGDAIALRAATGAVLRWTKLDPALSRALHDEGLCLGCFWPPLDMDDYPDAARLGLFRYEHVDFCENWISGPYGRESRPVTPLLIDELPEADRAWVSQVKIEDRCFRELDFIQPVDLMPCHSWQGNYVAMDGRTIRPMPGQEDDFDEAWAKEHYSSLVDARGEPLFRVKRR